MRYLDLDSWNRRQHFDLFKDYDKPFFNLCAPVDVTVVRKLSRQPEGPSFFLASLYLSLKAANDVESFRYRLRGDRVLVHDVIHGGSTILRDDDTFGFGYFAYDQDFERFQRQASEVMERIRSGPKTLKPRADQDDLIYYSVIPWISFTSFSHARRYGHDDSIPKIVFGKFYQEGERWRMPVSIEVHHALVDGLHVGRFFELYQRHLDEPPL
ncbi:MAG: chloramphenicol acetyltransferase [Thermoanaerobaculia bacterium]